MPSQYGYFSPLAMTNQPILADVRILQLAYRLIRHSVRLVDTGRRSSRFRVGVKIKGHICELFLDIVYCVCGRLGCKSVAAGSQHRPEVVCQVAAGLECDDDMYMSYVFQILGYHIFVVCRLELKQVAPRRFMMFTRQYGCSQIKYEGQENSNVDDHD